jgi:hypothetical protein
VTEDGDVYWVVNGTPIELEPAEVKGTPLADLEPGVYDEELNHADEAA